MKVDNYFENISHKFRLKDTEETRNYLLEEINQNELMSRKQEKVCTTLNYIARVIILASKITRCISFSAFDSLFGFP